MVWYAGNVETSGLLLCSVDNSVEQTGDVGSTVVAAVMAGAWLTPQKKARSTLEVCDINSTRGFGLMLTTTEDLARTLEANDLILIGDGGFKVPDRP
jgi:hypothetical protein